MVKCKKCGAMMVAYDNDSLYHEREWLIKNKQSFDNQITIHFQCTDCDETDIKTFDIK